MSRGAGSKAVSREEKRLQKEKERRIKEANRMLIPVPKNTVASMKLLSFDPAGTFRFEGNRWVRVYKLIRTKSSDVGLGELSGCLKAKFRITKRIYTGGDESVYVTLTERAETYDEVRTYFSEDEEKMSQYIEFLALNVDQVMKTISADKLKDFSYASMVRGRRDWKKECVSEVVEEDSSFKDKQLIGETMFVMQYPGILLSDVIEKLGAIGCDITVAVDMESITAVDQVDFGRALEQKYNRNGIGGTDFINASIEMMFYCDSDDARKIIEKTILSILSGEGFVIAPCVGVQKRVAESLITFDLLPYSVMRNVKLETMNQVKMWGGQTDGCN